jgi:hypothetical protein
MDYLVNISADILVSVEFGAENAVRRLVRDYVCNGWLLRCTPDTAKDAGQFVVKGLSGEVARVRPFIGNRRVSKTEEGESDE